MSDYIDDDKVKASISYLDLFKRLWPYCKRHLFLFSLAVVSVFLMAFLARLLPFLIGFAVDEGFQKNNFTLVRNIALLFLLVEASKTLTQVFCTYSFQKFGNRVLYYLREDLLTHVQKLPTQYFNKTPVGRLVTRLTNDVANLGDLFNEGVVAVAIEFVTIISLIIAMSIISIELSFYTLLLTPIFIFASFYISNKIREILRIAKKKLSELNSYVAENLSGIKIIQLFNRQNKNLNRFHHFSEDYKTLTLKSIRYYALMQPVMNLFNATTVTIALYAGGLFVIEDKLQIGALIAFTLLAQDFIQPLREILEKYQQFQNSLTSAERVFQLMDETEEKDNSAEIKVDQKGALRFQNLTFSYSSELGAVLNNINLDIPPGTSLALVGRTGSGKTTLVSLLQRLYPVPQSSIFIDGLDINSFSLERLRKIIGIVQQDNFIFRATLRENLRLSQVDISDKRLISVCQKIGYWDLLTSSGRDLDYFLEERGSNISVGERQLIAFARILIFQPEILILDEATANIDSQTESLIQKATEEATKDRTSIIIAHRLSTIKNCDLIVVLDAGQIVEMGTHSDLFAQRGLYYQLAEAGVKSTTTRSSAPGTASP